MFDKHSHITLYIDSWAKKDTRLSGLVFSKLSDTWDSSYIVRSDYARRELLLELDVLCAMLIGMSIDELILMYKMQFAVLNQYEEDTWYDKNGSIVFTSNRSLSGIGFDRKSWEKIKDTVEGEKSYSLNCEFLSNDATVEDRICIAPFDRCNRIEDYYEIWKAFNERFLNR